MVLTTSKGKISDFSLYSKGVNFFDTNVRKKNKEKKKYIRVDKNKRQNIRRESEMTAKNFDNKNLNLKKYFPCLHRYIYALLCTYKYMYI